MEGNFDASFYLRRLYHDPTDKERGVHPFRLKCFHDFYKKFCSSWDTSSAQLLEYGGGPVIYPLISACSHVGEITFSDYLQSCLDAVKSWKNDSEDSHNWLPYFKYVTSEIEGNTSEEVALQRQAELRRKLKHFVIGDILADDILATDLESTPKTFDIVSCNLCLEVPAKSVSDYKRNVKSLSKLVKPGGFVVSLVVLENSYFYSNDTKEKIFVLYLRENDVKEAYEEAGFTIVQSNLFVLEERARHIIDGSKANIFIVGQKK